MNFWLTLFLAGLILFVLFFILLVSTWIIATVFYFPLIPGSYGNRALIGYTLWSLFAHLASAFWLFPAALWTAGLSFLSILRQNLCYIFVLGVVCTGGYIWLENHDVIIQNYIYFRQCFSRPVIDFFLIPVLNILRMVYNAVIQPVNWWTNLYAFYEYGLPITLFKCGITTDMTNLLYFGANAFYAIFTDLSNFLAQDYFHASWNIMNSLDAIGLFIDSLRPIFYCLCQALNFIYTYISIFLNLNSLHNFGNYVWNWLLSIVQLGFNFIMDLPSYPNFDNITLNACGAIETAGDTFEDFVYLTGETGWGVLTNLPALPVVIAEVLSVPYTSTITHPICGLFRFINMTAVVVIHIPEVFDSTGSGVKFFQFGNIADELRAAVLAFGAFFAIFNQATQAFVSQFLLSVVAVLAFIFEWVIGNIFYFFYGGPLPATWGNRPLIDGGPIIPPYGFFSNFLRFYFVDYYLKAPPAGVPVTIGGYTYSSSLDQFFREVFLTDQALADLIGLINDPFGQAVRFAFDIIFSVLKVATNFISFLYCIFTFQCDNMPITFRNVDFDYGFNRFYYLAGALGDVVRQFDSNGCITTPSEDQKNLVCSTGNLIETSINTGVLVVQTITHFVQDLLTLPTFTVHLCIFGLFTPTNKTQCVRLPNFDTALYEWNTAICQFSTALTSLIPTIGNFQCQFPPPPTPTPGQAPHPPIQCGKVQSCMANELCSVLQLGTIPLQIMNAMYIKTLSGQFFVGFAEFLQFSFLLILGQTALIFSNFGLMLDCIICAFVGGNTNCAYPIYTVLYEFGQLVIAVAKIFTNILLEFARLLLALTIGLFGGGNPIQALIDFVVGVLVDVFGGLGTTVLKLLTGLLDAVGLGFIGQFINILWQGFCPLLQIVLNIFITIMNIVTLGAFGIKQTDLCCSGGNCTISGGNKRDVGEPLIDGKLYTNSSGWLSDLTQYYTWPENSPCNRSMSILKHIDWNYLSSSQVGNIEFCIFKDTWANRTDGQTNIGNSTCDEIVLENLNTDWDSFDVFQRGAVRDCIHSRLMTDALRVTVNQSWIPQDILTNSWRKYYFGLEMARGYLINWQYMNDQQKPVDVIMSVDYRNYWAGFGLDVSHLRALNSTLDVEIMRGERRLKNYFIANNATQYDAVLYTASGTWNLLNNLAQSLKTTMVALTDNQTNPVVYLSYNYSLDNAFGVAGTSALSIVNNFFDLITNFTSYWADKDNYKKRSAAWDHGYMGLQIAYDQSRRQLRLMAEEYFHDTLYVQQLRANRCGINNDQECDPNERIKYNQEYIAATTGMDKYGGETSIIYKLSQWWKNTSFKTYVIKNPIYGKNRSTYDSKPMDLQYLHQNGTMVNESLNGRFWRYVELVNKGTPAARRRWEVVWQLYDRAKGKFYKEFLAPFYDPHVIARNEKQQAMYQQQYVAKKAIHDKKPTYHNTHEIVCDDDHNCEVRVKPDPITLSRGSYPTATPTPQITYQNKYQSHKRSIEEIESEEDSNNYYYGTGKYQPFSLKSIQARAQRITLQEPDDNPFTVRRSPEFMALIYKTDDLFTITCSTNITIPCFPPLVCNGSTTTICEQCLYLDQLLGRVFAATGQLINYYTGGPFAYSMNLTFQLFQYSFDPNARVIVGDGPNNNVNEFPLALGDVLNGQFSNSVWLGDDTPDKLRFNDINDMINNALNASNTTLSNITLSAVATNLIDDINVIFIQSIIGWLDTLFQRIYFALTNGDVTAGGEVILSFIINWFILCDWLVGDDYSGVNKRFSIGEMFFIYAVTFFLTTFITATVFGINLCTLITGTSLSLIIFASTFMSLYSNWGFLCAPGLPVILMNDVMYFIVYNAFPKCSWFWGFLIRFGYNNDTCYYCDNTSQWQYYNCRRDLGFQTIIDNLVFFLGEQFPEVLQWIRDTVSPVFIIYQIPWVNKKLNQFVGVDTADPAIGATYRGCNVIVTLPWNTLNVILALIFFYMIISPIIGLSIIFASWLASLLWYMLILMFYILTDFIIILGSTPYDRIEDMDEDDYSVPFSRSSTGLSSSKLSSQSSPSTNSEDEKKKRLKKEVKQNSPFTKMENVLMRMLDNYFGDRKLK